MGTINGGVLGGFPTAFLIIYYRGGIFFTSETAFLSTQ
jgi:hypothetical protein